MTLIQTVQSWWQHQSLLGIAGVISGLICVYLAAKNIIWNWPLAIISVSIYIFIFYNSHLFADMGLQVYFLAVNIYGWCFWSKRSSAALKTPVTSIKPREILLSIVAIVAFTFFLGWLLFNHTSASFPYLDSFCTACSIVAQFFMARKVLQNWLLWVFVDTIYVGIYIIKDLHLTAAMYATYIVIAFIGYFDWKRELKKQLM